MLRKTKSDFVCFHDFSLFFYKKILFFIKNKIKMLKNAQKICILHYAVKIFYKLCNFIYIIVMVLCISFYVCLKT
jgi:hypothetical protein